MAFTTEQVEGINKIIKFKQQGNLYKVLDLQENCTESEIKKAYRKLGSFINKSVALSS